MNVRLLDQSDQKKNIVKPAMRKRAERTTTEKLLSPVATVMEALCFGRLKLNCMLNKSFLKNFSLFTAPEFVVYVLIILF